MSLTKNWPLVDFFSSKPTIPRDFALIVLNQPIPKSCLIFRRLFSQARLRVCADGGANELYRSFVLGSTDDGQAIGDIESFLPEHICGDLDSLLPDVEEFYKNKGVSIRRVKDQNTTDLTKSLLLIRELESHNPIAKKPLDLVVYGGIGGRFDHSIATIQFLYKVHDRLALVYSPGNITISMESGLKHSIDLPLELQGKACGLLPIGGPVTQCLTSGFRWDLNGNTLEFGGLVSSSNIADSTTLTVDLTESNSDLDKKYPLVFTIETNT